jgi:nucleotide-binding universal stress UspA family protein
MLSIRKILVPVLFTDLSQHVVHQAAWLARRFHAELVLLHVVSPLEYPAGVLEGGDQITARDLQAHIVQRAQSDLDQLLRPELEGITATRVVLRGNPAHEIVKAAHERNIDLIVMSTRGDGALFHFLLGSVTAKILHETPCLVWTGVHLQEAPVREFAIRHVLCSVDLSHRSRHTVSLAAEMAAAVDATLTLVHVTESVQMFGPGGYYTDPVLKEAIVGAATTEMAKLQQDIGTKADVIIESGNVTQLLNQAAEHTKADVLVIGHSTLRSHLGDNGNGYGIIRASLIPVLSV